jgi:hypothetical protein
MGPVGRIDDHVDVPGTRGRGPLRRLVGDGGQVLGPVYQPAGPIEGREQLTQVGDVGCLDAGIDPAAGRRVGKQPRGNAALEVQMHLGFGQGDEPFAIHAASMAERWPDGQRTWAALGPVRGRRSDRGERTPPGRSVVQAVGELGDRRATFSLGSAPFS